MKFVGCFDGVFYLYFLLFVIFDCSYDFNGVRSPRFRNLIVNGVSSVQRKGSIWVLSDL